MARIVGRRPEIGSDPGQRRLPQAHSDQCAGGGLVGQITARTIVHYLAEDLTEDIVAPGPILQLVIIHQSGHHVRDQPDLASRRGEVDAVFTISWRIEAGAAVIYGGEDQRRHACQRGNRCTVGNGLCHAAQSLTRKILFQAIGQHPHAPQHRILVGRRQSQ